MKKCNEIFAPRAIINKGQIPRGCENNNTVGEMVNVNTFNNVEKETRIKVANDSCSSKGNQKSDRNREEDMDVDAMITRLNLSSQSLSSSDFRKNTE